MSTAEVANWLRALRQVVGGKHWCDSMRDEFNESFDSQTFRYSEELFALLGSGAARVSRSCDGSGSRGNLPCQHYERNYRHRSQHLARKYSGKPYWDELRAATDELCSGLSGTPETACCLWSIKDDGDYEFVAFENAETGAIAGCLRIQISMHAPNGRTTS